MLVSARKGLLSGKFRHGGVSVDEERWTKVDPNDKQVRATLLAYVPSHIRVQEGQALALADAGLELKEGRLIDARAAKAANAKGPRAEK